MLKCEGAAGITGEIHSCEDFGGSLNYRKCSENGEQPACNNFVDDGNRLRRARARCVMRAFQIGGSRSALLVWDARTAVS